MAEKPLAVDEALIEKIVRHFYNRVGKDPLLGPIFNTMITDWEPHLQKMFAFWSAVMLQTGRYDGRPMPKHAVLPIAADHFERWLELFEQTVRELCTTQDADLFMYKARHIARNLETGVSLKNESRLSTTNRFHQDEKGANDAD